VHRYVGVSWGYRDKTTREWSDVHTLALHGDKTTNVMYGNDDL
jgi:hypothetical protein